MAKKQKKYDVKKVRIGKGAASKQVSQPVSNTDFEDENTVLEQLSISHDTQKVEDVQLIDESLSDESSQVLDDLIEAEVIESNDVDDTILIQDDLNDVENIVDSEDSHEQFVEIIGEDEDEIKGFFVDIEQPITIEEAAPIVEPIVVEEPVKQKKSSKRVRAKSERLALIGFRNALIIYAVLGVVAFVFYPRSDRKVIRPFDYVQVNFSGISQRGQADIEFIDKPEYTEVERELMSLMFKYYIIEPRFSLKSGQLIRVSLDTAKMGEVNEYLAQHKLRLDGVVKIMKVPKLPNYIVKDDDLRKDALPVFQQFAIEEGQSLIKNEFGGNLPPEGTYSVEIIKYYRFAREQFEGVVSNFAVVFKTSYKTTNTEGQEVMVEKYHIRYLNQIMYDAEGKVIFTKVDNFTSGEANLDDIIRNIRSNYTEFE